MFSSAWDLGFLTRFWIFSKIHWLNFRRLGFLGFRVFEQVQLEVGVQSKEVKEPTIGFWINSDINAGV